MKPGELAVLTGMRNIRGERSGCAAVRGLEKDGLEQILNTLSLWYDVDVFFQSESAKQLVFTGYMKRYNDISEILNAITDVVGVNFTINGKTIIVSK
ncbi:MAG: DUF4974 domain-containing protein [Butyricimonas faecihominis]